jgi:hypothetical protein
MTVNHPNILRSLFRAVGLSAFNYRTYRDAPEPKKPVFTVSRFTAWLRCVVHLLPSLVSITIIGLNWAGFFIGFQLAGIPDNDQIDMAALQVAAKLQELFVVASTATVIYHQLRHDLLHGQGVPFGLFSSGLEFQRLSYFWSSELLGSLPMSNWRLLLLIIVGGLIATLAGPATAVLIIPNQISYAAGSTSYYINGTTDVLWPSHIQMDHFLPKYNNSVGEFIDCSGSNGFKSAVCPAGGYVSLLDHFSANTLSNDAGQSFASFDGLGTYKQSPAGGILVRSPLGQVAPQTIDGIILRPGNTETFARAPHGATINLQQRLNHDWYIAVQTADQYYPKYDQQNRFRFYSSQTTSVKSQFPAVRVVCQGQSLSTNVSTALFPNIPSRSPAVDLQARILSSTSTTIPKIITQTAANGLDFQWVDLSEISESNQSLSISTGAIIRLNTSNTNGNIGAACSIDARWVSGIMSSSFPSPFRASPLDNSIPAPGYFSAVGTFFFNTSPAPTKITFDTPFLESINFATNSTTDESQLQLSSIESIVSAAGVLQTAQSWVDSGSNSVSLHYLEHILASILVDAISRAGSYRSYNTTGDVTTWPFLFYNSSLQSVDFHYWDRAGVAPSSKSNITTMIMKQTVSGYGYQLSDPSQYLAIVLLMMHLLLALGYTIYIIVVPDHSSSCWDSISELIVLAQQSPRSVLLQNTCAGVNGLKTFGHRVRVMNAEEDPDSLELRFYTRSEAKLLRDSNIEPGNLYGDETLDGSESNDSTNNSTVELSPLLHDTRTENRFHSISERGEPVAKYRNVHTF